MMFSLNEQITGLKYYEIKKKKTTSFYYFCNNSCRVWWHTPLFPALGRQRQPGLQSEFQDSQDYTEKPCLEKPK